MGNFEQRLGVVNARARAARGLAEAARAKEVADPEKVRRVQEAIAIWNSTVAPSMTRAVTEANALITDTGMQLTVRPVMGGPYPSMPLPKIIISVDMSVRAALAAARGRPRRQRVPAQIEIGLNPDGKIATQVQGCRVAVPHSMRVTEFGEDNIKSIIADFIDALVC